MRVDGISPMMAARAVATILPHALPRFAAGEGEGATSAQAAQTPPMTQAAAQAGQAAQVGQGAPVASVQMLVTLAAVDPAIERRRRMAEGACRGLDTLEQMHREIVAGTLTPERLREMADWAATIAMPDDPALAALIRDMDVRVRVELAKFDVQI